MAWFPCKVGGSGGIPAQLQTDMDAVLNKKFGTTGQTYPSTDWADDVNLMGVLPVRSASGAIASFSDGADDVPLKSGKFTFNAVQASGTPTPSVPIPISGFTGMNISRTGKNLLPNKTYQRNANTLRLGTDSLDGTLTYKAGTYTLSVKTEKAGNLVYTPLGGSSVSITTSTIDGKRVGTFTLTETTELFFHINISGGITSADVSELQLEVGSSATAYKPFQAPTIYPVTWTSEGTIYGGYVKVNADGSAELWKTHGIYTFSGNEGWSQQGDLSKYYSQAYLVRSDAKRPASNAEAVTIVTSIGTFNTPYNVLENYPDTINLAADGRLTINASLKKESETLAGVQVVYELATYVKVCDLPDINISTLLGTNNIFHDANGDSEVEYRVNVNPTANLWGGLKMAQDISKGITGNNLVLTSDYVRFAASSVTSGLPAIFSDFKENTQYTIILAFANSSVYSSNVVTPNLEFIYTDGTGETFNTTGVANTKYVVAVTSTEGKTISKISLYYNYGTSNIYYNESGLFEGIKTVDDFVPYNRYLIDV